MRGENTDIEIHEFSGCFSVMGKSLHLNNDSFVCATMHKAVIVEVAFVKLLVQAV